MSGAADVILELPATYGPVRHIRSTLLISSFASIREAGHESAYLDALDTKYHDVVRQAVAGSWIPIDVGVAHYAACSAAVVSHDAQVALGRKVGEKVRGTLLGTVVRMAREVGVTPWNVLPLFQRFWNRAFDGGGLYAMKVGPKECLLEVHQAAMVDVPYFRASLCGLASGVLDLFCRKAYMTERKTRREAGSAAFRVQWV